MVKMREKLELLKEGVYVMSHILEKLPEVEIITDGNTQYFVDSEITRSSTDIEYLTPHYGVWSEIYLYKDIDFYTSNEVFFTRRIYSKEVFKYQIYALLNDRISFNKKDYCEHLCELGANPIVISKINAKIIDLISSNKYSLDQQNMPNKLKKLLPFI